MVRLSLLYYYIYDYSARKRRKLDVILCVITKMRVIVCLVIYSSVFTPPMNLQTAPLTNEIWFCTFPLTVKIWLYTNNGTN
jgi:uncharacterized membrane-anchored protein